MKNISAGFHHLEHGLRRALSVLLPIFLLSLCFWHRTAAGRGVSAGLQLCLYSLLPSLFPFLVLSAWITDSQAAAYLCRLLSPVLRHGFHLPPAAAPALLFGLTAGYPVGGKLTAQLLQDGRLNREQAGRLLLFSTGPGYAFPVVFLGEKLGCPTLGLPLFVLSVVSPLCIGLVLARFAPLPEKTPPPAAPGMDLPKTVRSGLSAMGTLCAFVCTFSAVLEILRCSGLFSVWLSCARSVGIPTAPAAGLLAFLLEVTAGVQEARRWCMGLPLFAFGLGFGGLCVQLQVLSFFGASPPVSFFRFFLFRLCNGALCFVFALALDAFFPAVLPAAALYAPLSPRFSTHPPGSFSLLLLTAAFLFTCLRQQHSFFPKNTPTPLSDRAIRAMMKKSRVPQPAVRKELRK